MSEVKNILPYEEKDKFDIYYEYLIEENNKYNLTAITKRSEVDVKHFYDSLELAKVINLDGKQMLDVGSGAGFPSIPLKIITPSLKVTIIEPTKKRVDFLKELVKKLKLTDVDVICGRAEVEAKKYRYKYDIVTARAVAGLPILLELCASFISSDGVFVAYKGSSYKEELEKCDNACKELGLCYSQGYDYTLPNDNGKRALLFFKRVRPTDLKYPRLYKDIKKKPLWFGEWDENNSNCQSKRGSR